MGSYETAGYNLGSGFIDPSDSKSRHIKQRKDAFYLANYTGNSAFWMQGAIDMRFKVGDQSLYSYFAGANYNQNYQRFFFNLCRRHVNMLCGFQRRNRKSTITVPIHDEDDALSDDWCKMFKWCEGRDGFQEYLSESFEGGVTVGENLLWMYPDYTFDPVSSDIMTDAVAWNNYLIDQYTRKQDLSDCSGVYRRRWVSKEGAKQLIKGYDKEIDRMRPAGMKDGRFPVQAELQNAAISQLFTYDEFHYRTTRNAKMIIDPLSGEATEWEPEDGEDPDMLDRVLAQQPWLIVKDMDVPTCRMSLALGDKEIYDGPNHFNIDLYPCVPSQCYVDNDIPQYSLKKMGIIRNMRDAQFLYNMRKVIELQMLQSSVNAGFAYVVDSVTDTKALRQSSGGDGFLIPIKNGRNINESIQRFEPVNIPGSLLELSQSLADVMTQIVGTNEELLGSAVDDKSGILSMLRQGAGLTTLQTIFDKLDYTQRLYGKIRMHAIRKNFSKGKVRNILGHEADPRFWSTYSLKYSIAVEEGNYSATQRQTELQQLLYFKELGMNIPDKSIMRKAIISDKRQLIQDIEESAQQQQQAAQAEAAQKEKVDNAKIMKEFSASKLNMAKTDESYAKVEELYASADHKKAQTEYDLVKSMLELENMDLDMIHKSYQIAMAIKGQNTDETIKTAGAG